MFLDNELRSSNPVVPFDVMDNGQAPFLAFVDAAITSVRQCDDLRKLRSPAAEVNTAARA